MGDTEERNSENEESISEASSFILFEGENEVSGQRFGYEYSGELNTEGYIYPDVKEQKNAHNTLFKWEANKDVHFRVNTLGVITKCNEDYKQIREDDLKFSYALCLLKVDLTQIAQHDMKNYLQAVDKKKRQNIPKLWIYDYPSTYTTNYTDKERINKNIELINNLL